MEPATIFLLVMCTLLGAAVGGLIQHSMDRRRAPPPPAIPSAEPLSTPEQLTTPGPLPTPGPTPSLAAGEVEILRAGRTPSGSAWLDMDGIRLGDKGSLQPEQRRRLVNTLVDLRPWLEAAAPLPAAPDSQPAPVLPVVPALKAARPDPNEAKPVIVLKSIVEQINDVLQAKLQAGPLKDRGILLTEGAGGVVLVRDGLNKYEGIDGVPDLEVRALIRQAVADWEKLPPHI